MRYLKIAAGVVLAGAALWYGLWLAGQGRVTARLEQRILDLEAVGWAMTVQDRQIAGFPFGYEITLDTVALVQGESGLLIKIPSMMLDWDPTAPDDVVARLPELIEVDMPVSALRREANPELPEMLFFRLASEGLTLRGTGGGMPDLSAGRLSVMMEQEDFSGSFALSATDVSSSSGVASASALEARVDNNMGPGGQAAIQMQLSAPVFRTSDAVSAFAGLGSRIYAAASTPVGLEYAAEVAVFAFSLTGDPSGNGGRLAADGRGASGALRIEDGVLHLEAESEASAWTWTSEGVEASGTVSAATAWVSLALPTAPTSAPVPAMLSLALDGVAGDTRFWAEVDPAKALDRTPGAVALDLDATLRVTAALNAPRRGPPPFEVSNVSVNGLSLDLLGASLQAEGDVEILQPIAIPLGRLAVRGSRIAGLVGDLSRAGLITPEMVAAADAMLQVYARPATGADSWETEIDFSVNGVSVNGLPIR